MTETVLVTGGATSVGHAIVEKFAARGCQVTVNDLSGSNLEIVQKKVAGLRCIAGNISDPAVRTALFLDENQQHLNYDYIVNTVGIPGERAMLEDIDLDDWRLTMEVNVVAALAIMQAAVPGMKTRGSGGIVNFSSSSTLTGLPGRLPYIASKFALEGLTKTAARELGPYGIRCNAILPGFIDNVRGRRVVEEAAVAEGRPVKDAIAESLRYVSLRKMVTPEELAEMALYLCSSAGRSITGQLVAVDGNSEWDF